MALNDQIKVVAMIIFLVPVGIFIPTMLGETTSEESEVGLVIYEGEEKEVGDLQLEVLAVNGNNTDLFLYDKETGEGEEFNLDVDESEVLSFDSGDIEITVNAIHMDERVLINMEYPSTYGFSESEESAESAMPLVTVLPILVITFVVFYKIIYGGKQ